MTTPGEPLIWLRKLCESLHGVEEVIAWGHPTFKVAGRAITVFEVYRGRPSIAIKVDLEKQDFLIESSGFFKTPYIGHKGWVSVWVDQPFPSDLLQDLVTTAHTAALLAPPRPSRGSKPPLKPSQAAKPSAPRSK